LPESFRGGCSFGAGTKADLSRRDALEQIRGKHDWAKAVNAAAALSTAVVLCCCGKPMIPLHSFWTPPFALSKSVAPEDEAICGKFPALFAIGWT
jgi:hypothetical protein